LFTSKSKKTKSEGRRCHAKTMMTTKAKEKEKKSMALGENA
jgi:hypothetical protein